MAITVIPWIVVLVFGGIFVFAAIREILHRRAHGPATNPRDAFEFDEDAPSYEEPEVADTHPDDAPPDRDTDGAPGTPDGRADAADDDPADTPGRSRADRTALQQDDPSDQGSRPRHPTD